MEWDEWMQLPFEISNLPPTAVLGPETESLRLEKLAKQHQRCTLPHVDWLDKLAFRVIEQEHESEVDKVDGLLLTVEMPNFDLPVVFAEPEPETEEELPVKTAPAPAGPCRTVDASLFTIYDPEGDKENIIEAKHRRLVRFQRSNLLDRERKPTASVRDELNDILLYPSTRKLKSAEKDLIWSFRFHLTRYPKGLTKFLKSVVWSDPDETRQATDVLLPMWAEPELSDALELLGPWFRDLRVRAYAVRLLERASDEELELYLLQLVQAIKFDEMAWNQAHRHQQPEDTETDALVDGSKLVDLLCMQLNTNASLEEMLSRQTKFVELLSSRCKQLRLSRDARPKKIEKLRALLADKKGGLHTFHPALSLPLDPLVSVVKTVPENSTVFKSNLFPLRIEFEVNKTQSETPENELKSGPAYTVICKDGDDLRQDQLVIQLFALMDRLLRNENLDLKITPYRVLATSPSDGMVQYIQSMTIAAIMASYNGSVLEYLRANYPDKNNAATYFVQSSVLDTFVRSCAGYCVITYLLGVGDRHLDNLLLSPDGHFFHVDFGYILGRDPKPFPPPVKICKEMVDGMGGANSVYYARFRKLCNTAYASLRKNANLILNLVSLMVDANIPDIRSEPDKAVLKIQEKFMLDVSEEKAVMNFEALFNETSYISSMFDRLHNMAQAAVLICDKDAYEFPREEERAQFLEHEAQQILTQKEQQLQQQEEHRQRIEAALTEDVADAKALERRRARQAAKEAKGVKADPVAPPSHEDIMAKMAYIHHIPNTLHKRLVKGYFLSTGLRFGGDFVVYPGDPLRYHSHYTATILATPQQPMAAYHVVASGRLVTLDDTEALERRLAGYDDATDTAPAPLWGNVEYWSLAWAGFGT
ncbi:phosphatidylinositol 3-kinase [Malassezia brasiliensis]|uniref:Vacuolar protein sorting-associated protein 34 n=1 Tax=Malassezia brasiliensis TaxID=1821822 RepID=A0AAF0DU88_9BASI|nr:phosphatidylinositol 3-kinase [Malassezia brasiliensis]